MFESVLGFVRQYLFRLPRESSDSDRRNIPSGRDAYAMSCYMGARIYSNSDDVQNFDASNGRFARLSRIEDI